MLDGRFRDPLVGRDVLIGGALGTAAAALISLGAASYHWLGQAPPVSGFFDFWDSWRGFPGAVAELFGRHLRVSLQNALGGVLLFVLLYIVLRSKWLAAAGLFVLAAAFFGLGIGESVGPQLVFALLVAMLLTLAVTRFGVLTAVIYWYAFFLLIQMPLTTDLSSWYFGVSLLAFGLPLSIGVWAFRTAVAGQPLADSA